MDTSDSHWVHLKHGSLLVDAPRLSAVQKKSLYFLHSDLRIGIRGTKFSLSGSEEDSTQIEVIEGRLAITRSPLFGLLPEALQIIHPEGKTRHSAVVPFQSSRFFKKLARREGYSASELQEMILETNERLQLPIPGNTEKKARAAFLESLRRKITTEPDSVKQKPEDLLLDVLWELPPKMRGSLIGNSLFERASRQSPSNESSNASMHTKTRMSRELLSQEEQAELGSLFEAPKSDNVQNHTPERRTNKKILKQIIRQEEGLPSHQRIHLKDGRTIEGFIYEEKGRFVIVTSEGKQSFPLSEIKSIEEVYE